MKYFHLVRRNEPEHRLSLQRERGLKQGMLKINNNIAKLPSMRKERENEIL